MTEIFSTLSQQINLDEKPKKDVPPMKLWQAGAIIFGFIALLAIMWFFIFPPVNFPVNSFVRVNKGDTVSVVAENLFQKNIIKSPTTFKIFVRLLGGDKRLLAGTYFFKEKTSSLNVAMKLTLRFLGYRPLRVTIPEGASNDQIAVILEKQVKDFNKDEFLARTVGLEGRLFPDTYFFSPFDTTLEILTEMNDNFNEQVKKIDGETKKTGKSFSEILIMASIIEREARLSHDRKIVSGILWKRIAMNMPLQVDATFAYILPRNTFELTKDDLKTDSLYNTYINKGLPPTPIANPGLDSILAATNPEYSPYIYYLSDRQGNMHFAKTYAEHKQNVARYLGR